MKLTSLLIFISFISSICGFKVLGVFPYFSKSHFAIGSAIVESLHEAGHDITVISPFPKKNKVPRYHDISVVDFYEKNDEGLYSNFNM
jgi:glucuronosyltransferase